MKTSDATIDSVADGGDYPSRRYAWYVTGVLMVVYVFNFMDRMILTLLVTPIKRDLGLSDTQISYLMGFSFAVFYCLLGFPMGRLADRANRKSLIAWGLTTWTLMTAACGLAKRYWQMFLLRVGVGVGEASLGPAAYSIITDYFPKSVLARALSFYSCGIILGAGLAVLVGGHVSQWAKNTGPLVLPLVGTLFPWQVAFLIVGVAGFAPLLLLTTIREPVRRGVRLITTADGRRVAHRVPFGDVLRFLRKNLRTVLSHHLGFSMLSFSSYGLGAWKPVFMERTHGWEPGQIGTFFGMHVIIVGGMGMLIGGWLTDRLARLGVTDAPIRVGLIGSIMWIPFGVSFPLVENEWACWGLMATAYFFVTFPVGSAAAAIMQIVPNAMRGQATALYFFSVNIVGLGIGPSAVAWFTDYVFQDEALVRYSMLIVGLTAHVLAAIAFAYGLRSFRDSVENLRRWEETHLATPNG